jgi:NADH-quinone oxidoreductase subunit G
MCIDICPVGALTSHQYRYKTRPWEMQYVGTTCAHCGDGCKTTLNVRNNEVLRGNNRDKTGINGDFLCIKGRYGGDFAHHPDRLRRPLIRRSGRLEPVSWDEALDYVARGLKEIRDKSGPDSIGFLGSNRTTNEENYLLQRFARAVIGTNNVDHHRTADYAALVSALGGDSSRFASARDLLRASAILLVGNDPTHNHPLLAAHIRLAVRHNGARLYIVNTREIKLRRQAKNFLLVPPGQEATAAESLLDSLRDEKDLIVLFGSEVAGSDVEQLVRFTIGLPGTTRYIALGDYSNSRGAADLGLLPDRLPGYAPVADAAARDRWGQIWKAALPTAPGLNAREMLTGGKLRALYVVGSNPIKTFKLENRREALGPLDLLVVHELFLTETAALADVVLPAACAYEKEGTVTNTCGELQRVKRALEAVGLRSDFEILRLLSYALGQPIPLRTPEAALEEIRQHVPGYQVSLASVLAGEALLTAPVDGRGPVDTAAGLVFSSDDSLFTSGTLSRFSQALNSVPERDLPRSRL